jgi:hypothetical protein
MVGGYGGRGGEVSDLLDFSPSFNHRSSANHLPQSFIFFQFFFVCLRVLRVFVVRGRLK